jgi:hypothetical protein
LLNNLPLVMLMMMGAVLLSQPLGMDLQRHFTTDGDPADLEIVGVSRQVVRMPFSNKPVAVHRVTTRSS